MCFGQNSKRTTTEHTTKQRGKHKNTCRNLKSNPERRAYQSDALHLHHRVNWKYRLLSGDFTISRQWVET